MGKTAMTGRKAAISKGMRMGLKTGLTGRVVRRRAPAVPTSGELQAMAWDRTGNAIRKALETQR